MSQLFIEKINREVNLTYEEQELCKRFFVPRKLHKRQFLLQQGDVCNYTAFIEKGLLRSYTLGEKGHEYILQFAFEGWWISDVYSLNTGEPSIYTIDALEDSEILLLSKASQEAMMQQVPRLERFFRVIFQNAFAALQRRMTVNISESTAGKYVSLLNSYPDIAQRVPQHMIASYLGVSPEGLSRIRKQMV